MSRASLNELEAVIAIATRKSFRAAARELDLSPSALSHAVSALEERMGVRLFHRTTRSVSLTAAGAYFVERMQPALREMSSVFEAVRELRDTPSGLLRIATSVGAAQLEVLAMALEMRKRHPDVKIEISCEDRLVDIVADGFDAGVRLVEAVPQDMVAVPIGSPLAMAVVATRGYLAKHGTPKKPSDLLKHDCIRRRFVNGRIMRWELEKRGRTQTIDVAGSLTLDNDDLVRQAARAGAGLAFIADGFITADLVRVLADWTPSFGRMAIFHPGNRLMRPALRAFIDVAKASAR